jgi:hypothetical protein
LWSLQSVCLGPLVTYAANDVFVRYPGLAIGKHGLRCCQTFRELGLHP